MEAMGATRGPWIYRPLLQKGVPERLMKPIAAQLLQPLRGMLNALTGDPMNGHFHVVIRRGH